MKSNKNNSLSQRVIWFTLIHTHASDLLELSVFWLLQTF